MLPKKNRLTKSVDFNRLKKGKKIIGKHVRLFYLPGSQQESRVGIVVSKVVSKNASVRNKAKRAIREAVRRNFYRFNGVWDVVIIANPSSARAYTNEIMEDLHSVFTKSPLV